MFNLIGSRCFYTKHKECLSFYNFYKFSNNFLKPTTYNITNKSYLHREINEKVQEKLKSEDDIPNSYKIIYRAPFKNYVKITYSVAFASIIVMTPLIGSTLFINGFQNFPLTLSDIEVITNLGELIGFIGGLILTTVQVSVVVFKYPFRIYKNSKEKRYIAIYQHLLPWKHKKEEFAAGELIKSTRGIMPWKHSLYEFKDKKAVLLENYFTRPADLTEMLHSESEAP